MNIDKAIEILESGLITQQEQAEAAAMLRSQRSAVVVRGWALDATDSQLIEEVRKRGLQESKMNERIKELAEQAGFISLAIYNMSDEIQRIVELAEVAAVAREREACAKLLESVDNPLAKLLAETIRGRTA
jgi:hypothetical protein